MKEEKYPFGKNCGPTINTILVMATIKNEGEVSPKVLDWVVNPQGKFKLYGRIIKKVCWPQMPQDSSPEFREPL